MEKSKQIETISIIGSGNVASSLGFVLLEAGIKIKEIYSRTAKNAESLAKKLDCSWVDNLNVLDPNSDLYLIAISDDQLSHIGDKLGHLNGIVAHTSGSQPINILKSKKGSSGIFYPLQTMTKSQLPDFTNIPICIEANNSDAAEQLKNLADKISTKVVYLNSDQRQYLHLTAVTVNNFTNLLYNHAHDVLMDKEIDFSLLIPLINETADKIRNTHPKDAQTGPARRNDKAIINKHLKLLDDYPDYQELYSLLSNQLIRKYHDKL